MARSKTKLTSKLPQAIAGMHDAFDDAVKEALIVGQEVAQSKLEKTGYDVDPFAVWKKHFKRADGTLEGGMIFVHSDKWYYKFFETGTVYIRATPFMRPAHRKMKATFLTLIGDKAEPAIRKRAKL